jgi:large subunit ribosomal protein L19
VNVLDEIVADQLRTDLPEIRRIASGVGVERTFKIHSPRIDRIEVIRHGVARRAQLYFLRDRVGKAATLRERR